MHLHHRCAKASHIDIPILAACSKFVTIDLQHILIIAVCRKVVTMGLQSATKFFPSPPNNMMLLCDAMNL